MESERKLSYAKGEEVTIEFPEYGNITTMFLEDNIRKGLGDKVAFYYEAEEPRKYTYKDVLNLTNRAGNMLKDLGVDIENRVMLILYDSPELVASFLGAIRIGAIPIPTNYLLTPEELVYMANDSRSRVVIINEQLLDKIEPVRDRLEFLRYVIVVGKAREGYLAYHELINKASDTLEPVKLDKDDVIYWQYSSGTTGPPKGVCHMHHDMYYAFKTYYTHVLGINENDVAFSASKLFFAYGLGNTLYAPMLAGATAVLYPGPPTPEKCFEIIQKYKVTLFFSVPTLYLRMLQVKDAESKYDLSSLRLCVSAGEALPPSVYEEWKKRFGIEILDGIGTTELTHIFISNRPGKVRPGSSGIPVPGYEVKIVDDEGNIVPIGVEGRLLVKGDSISPYYWRKHEKSKKAFLGEWFDTGDAYVMNEDGTLSWRGRTDDLIKVAGAWVSPVDIETTLIQHPAVLEAAAVASYTDEGLPIPKAFVVLKEGYSPSDELAEELIEFCESKIGYRRPRKIEFVKELPKTATGKIMRYVLRDMEKKRFMEKQRQVGA